MKLLWADVCADTLNIDLDDVERKLSRDTRILLFVHWGGYPVDYARLTELKAEYRRRFNQDLIVIEDCAHAWESRYQGQFVGNVQPRNFACFSFQAIKALTCGDGGLLIAPENDSAATEGPRDFYRQRGWPAGSALTATTSSISAAARTFAQWGFKFHLNDLAASLGLANYPHIHTLVDRHKQMPAGITSNSKASRG